MSSSPRTLPGTCCAPPRRRTATGRRTSRATAPSPTGTCCTASARPRAGYRALGLGTGDRVVVWAPNSIDWAVAALAVSYAGGVLVPANSRYTGHEVADLVDRTGARLVVVADGFLGRTQIADLAGRQRPGLGDAR